MAPIPVVSCIIQQSIYIIHISCIYTAFTSLMLQLFVFWDSRLVDKPIISASLVWIIEFKITWCIDLLSIIIPADAWCIGWRSGGSTTKVCIGKGCNYAAFTDYHAPSTQIKILTISTWNNRTKTMHKPFQLIQWETNSDKNSDNKYLKQ